MSIKKPQVSIIMATYNRCHLISETLDSILNQTLENWECLIIDDGSTDNTKEILPPYLLKDSRLKYYKRSKDYKKGLPGCRNQGLEIAKGDYIIFFDDDDIVHPQLLELSVKEIQSHKVDYCRYLRTIFTGIFQYNFDYELNYAIKHLGIRDIDRIVMNELPFNSCQILWKKSCFENNSFNEELMYAEEWELYSRILGEGKKGISIQKVLFFGRKHSKSNTGEFQKNDRVRIASNIKAYELVIENLASKRLLKNNLINYFIKMGFYFNSRSIIRLSLKYSNFNNFKKFKYEVGYIIYPVLKPFFNLKGKLKKS